MSTRSIAPEPRRLRREQEEQQPPAHTDKPSDETLWNQKPDEPIGEAFPDRDPTKKKTGEF